MDEEDHGPLALDEADHMAEDPVYGGLQGGLLLEDHARQVQQNLPTAQREGTGSSPDTQLNYTGTITLRFKSRKLRRRSHCIYQKVCESGSGSVYRSVFILSPGSRSKVLLIRQIFV